jgi:A/G-specific adenine glycosylase
MFGIETPINQSNALSQFSKISLELMNGHAPGIYNQAIMELGATVCTPRNPICENCPLSDSCFALEHKSQSAYPKKIPAKAKTNRYLNYVIMKHDGKIRLLKRNMADIWKGMYQPFLVESEKLLNHQEVENRIKEFGPGRISQFADYKHLLTHRTLHIRFFVAEVQKPMEQTEDIWIIPSELAFFALPKPIADFFSRYGEEL